ncbi:UNVERIFIED_ORG: glutamine synthetase [Pseudomonas vranovensis]|nr:glutamine synthetase [Pseudomonas vranovensis]
MSSNLDQLTDWLKEHKITEVECLISDLTGITRGKISPTNKFIAEKGMRLPESVLLQTVTGDYVDDDIYYELLDPADIDMICRPDENAVFLVPWAIEPTAQVIHDTYDKQGNPVELSPRNVLKKVLKLYADKGWQPIVAPEMEFYLTKRCEDPDFPLQPPIGRSGRPETGRQSFSIEAANEFDPLFEDVYDWCELQNLDLDTLIHEDGTAQMEINFRHGNALSLADQILVFKRTMREAALKHNVAATFMAKPMTGEPGSAMHLHQSIIDVRTGKNIFLGRRREHERAVPQPRRRPAEVHSGGVAVVRTERQLVPPLPARHLGTRERRVGRREPYRGPARTGCRAAESPGRKPPARRRRQPVPGDRRQPAVRLHRHGRRHQAKCAGAGAWL